MHKYKILFNLIFIIACVLFLSCSASSPVNSWKNPEYKNARISKLLCIAILKDSENKRNCEDMLDYEMQAVNINGSISRAYSDLFYEPSLKNLTKVISENKYDYLLTVSSLISITEKANYSDINMAEYFEKSLNKIKNPDYSEIFGNSNVEVILFSVKDIKPVWACIIKTVDEVAAYEISVELAKEISKSLKREEIIK
jgi:hypothetical protein